MASDPSFNNFTDISAISVGSFLDKIGEDNNTSDLYFSEIKSDKYLSSIKTASTSDEIINLLQQYPNNTLDTLIHIYGSVRIRNNSDFQKIAFQATKTWCLMTSDVIAKTLVTCCKLCGFGTTIKSNEGFQELQHLAKKNAWFAYYYLGFYYRIGMKQQANEDHNLSGTPLSIHMIQPVDNDQAMYWYKKFITEAPIVQSIIIQYYVAEAQFRLGALNIISKGFNLDNIDESIEYLKQSASVGHKMAEFSLGLLIELGIVQNNLSAKEYYERSANKNCSHAQVQLALMLLKSGSPEAITWLTKATKLGDSRAFFYLGMVYEKGKIVKANSKIAVQNYTTSADKYNNPMAEFYLGLRIACGKLGLAQDMATAIEYLERSAKHGYSKANDLLYKIYSENKTQKV